jgi:hypothetical protein
MQFISPTIAGYHLAWRFIAFVWVCMWLSHLANFPVRLELHVRGQ